MCFARRFPLLLWFPPTATTLPIAILFLFQLLRLDAGDLLKIGLTGLLVHGTSSALFLYFAHQTAKQMEESISVNRDVASTLSKAFVRIQLASYALWVGGGAIFAAVATLAVLPSLRGLAYFGVAALIGASPGTAWTYFTAKRLIRREARRSTECVRYLGPMQHLGRKIAVVFIGAVAVALLALALLVSERVSSELELLALGAGRPVFEQAMADYEAGEAPPAERLDHLQRVIPADYWLYVVDSGGNVVKPSVIDAANLLHPADAAHVRELRSGTSRAFVANHPMMFQQLKDGSSIVLLVPWSRAIPNRVMFYTLMVALLTIAVFAAATYYFSVDVNVPLAALQRAVREMAQGNFEAKVAIFADDEIGALGLHFEETRDQLQRLIAGVRNSGVAITDGVGIINGGTDRLVIRAKEQAALTRESNESLTSVRTHSREILSAVEAVTQAAQASSGRAGELEATADEVARGADYLFQSVAKTSSSLEQMNAAARSMSGRTGNLASIGEDVVSFVTQMESTVKTVRTNAASTSELSKQVREDAAAGGAAVGATVDGIAAAREKTERAAVAMQELQSSVEAIGRVLSVIEDITGQTNLLALNAAIIAAQAGNHGKGFGVVADEIRELADRTKNSTKEISAIVKAVQAGSREALAAIQEGLARVSDNVRLAEHASVSLEKIVESATVSYEMSESISSALAEQSASTRHLHEASARLSDHISEIDRATREQAEGTHLLADEAERVRDVALRVKNSTDKQTAVSRSIFETMEVIAGDILMVRDLLQQQSVDADRIAAASQMMLVIAQDNEAVAQEFTHAVGGLARGGSDFEAEVSRFKLSSAMVTLR